MNAYKKAAKPTAAPPLGRSPGRPPRHFVDFSSQVPATANSDHQNSIKNSPGTVLPHPPSLRRHFAKSPRRSLTKPAWYRAFSHRTAKSIFFRILHFSTPPPFSPFPSVQISPARKKFSSAPASCTFAPTQFTHVPSVKGCGGFEP